MATYTSKLDIIVYGSTGYTGRAVCARLASIAGENNDNDLKFGISGRDKGRLKALAAELGGVPTFAAAAEVDALTAVFSQTSLVINVAGPYALCSSNVVAACVAARAHYVDVTGESEWVRHMANLHGEAARSADLVLAHQCGFDSTVADVGAWRARQALKEASPSETPSTCSGYIVFHGTPTLTNGTFLTALESGVGGRETYAFPPSPSHLRTGAHTPVLPVPPLHSLPSGAHQCALPGAPTDAKANLMQQPDAPMVNWSNAMRGEAGIEYAQYAIFAGSVPLCRKFALASVGLLAVLASAFCKLLPSGMGASARKGVVHMRGHHAGPTQRDIERTHVTALFECKGSDGGVGRVRVEVGEAYAWTATAAVATALAVLKDRGTGRCPRTNGSMPPVGGLGEPLVERLIAAGMRVTTFE